MKIIEQRIVPDLAALYLAELEGEPRRRVEFVDTREPGVPKSEKWVMMISTQAGCAVGCRMCDAGAAGFQGSLSVEEMLGQVRWIAGRSPGLDWRRHPKLKIHFARMGEPALNPAVPEALAVLAREAANPGLIASVSTVAPKSPAVAPWFERLLAVKDEFYPGGRFQLQFSLHAVDEARRGRIVPIKKWSLAEVAAYGRHFVKPGDRRITLNFAPGPGEPLEADAIAGIFDPGHFLVKVTPINPTLAADRSGATFAWNEAPPHIAAAAEALRRKGFQVILSPSAEAEISSETSCGQLWSRSLKAEAEAGLRAERRETRAYVTADSASARAEAWLKDLQSERRRERSLRAERAALLVVDMQDFFLDRRSEAYLPSGRAILRGVRMLAEAFRRAGRPVLFTLHAHRDPAVDGGLMAGWWDKLCLAGSPGARVAAVLEAPPGDVYRKTGYSGFSNPELAERLRREGVSQLVVAGIKTDLCVESTVRAAFDLGFETFIPVDATAAGSEERHLSALRGLVRGFSAAGAVSGLLRAVEGKSGAGVKALQ
ncbi:MAG: isochorismatase family protein [Elusimicrobia bacterium]|nr:isochorismatase family protein [Elusimicrobiota bacterium]